MSFLKKDSSTQEITLPAAYKRSSYCSTGGCVEVAQHEDGSIALRDSKNVAKEAFVFTSEEWAAFVKGVKAGEFEA